MCSVYIHVYAGVHAHVEARGRLWVFSSVTFLPLTPSRQDLALTRARQATSKAPAILSPALSHTVV